ncbi:MAG: YiiD C-terminal domain-containing protein [Pseudoxanthomonas sp.]
MQAASIKATSVQAALEVLRAHTRDIRPLAAMHAQVLDYDGAQLRLTAPLALNVNDKGSAFGGSMTSLMTYAGWGLVILQLQQASMAADVFVADSSVRYLKPLYGDLLAEATLAPDQSWPSFLQTLAQRGRSRIQLHARIVLPDGQVMADLAGRYVAIAKG